MANGEKRLETGAIHFTKTQIYNPRKTMNKRIYQKNIHLDHESILDFFEERARKFDVNYPYVSVNYQDKNPSLTFDRDQAEKEFILPILKLDRFSSVLDIGCGIGRWADSIYKTIGYYHGTDFSSELIKIAKSRFKMAKHINFQNLRAQETCSEKLSTENKFNTVIISGLLIYLSDEDIIHTFENMKKLMQKYFKIYIREPIALEQRLTLNKIFSEELDSEYSAIYRTKEELINLITNFITENNLSIKKQGFLFPENLSNRKETQQYYILLERNIVENLNP